MAQLSVRSASPPVTETMIAYHHLVAQTDCAWADAHHAPAHFDAAYFKWSVFRRQTIMNEFWRARNRPENTIPLMVPGALAVAAQAAEYQPHFDAAYFKWSVFRRQTIT